MAKLQYLLLLIPLCAYQYASASSAESAIAKYQQAVDELEAEYGAYDIGLAEPLQGLGKALQSNGEHQEAIAAFKQSLHVRRVNDGINSLSQEPILRLLNSSYQAMDNSGAVATNYQRQLDLYQSHYGSRSTKLLPLQLEAAQWHRQQYAKLRNKEAAAHLSESIRLVTAASNINALYNGELTTELLNSEIENHYFLIQHYQQFSPRPPQEYVRRNGRFFRRQYRDETNFEYRIARDDHIRRETARLTKRYQKEQINNATGNALAAYEKLNRIHKRNGEPLQQANSLVQQADWLVLFDDRSQQAHNLYRQSWQLLTDNNQLEERTRLFGEPQLLPIFDTRDPANFEKIARVKMDIDLSGKARNITVLETQPEEKSVARKARRQLRDARFRSRFDNGEPVSSEGYELSLLLN